MAPGGLWEQTTSHFAGEQLAYIAGFAVGADVIFSDRPKAISYKRLWHQPTTIQYDEAYSMQATSNYHDTAGLPAPGQVRWQVAMRDRASGATPPLHSDTYEQFCIR